MSHFSMSGAGNPLIEKHRSIEIVCGHRTSGWRFGYPYLHSLTVSPVQWFWGTIWWQRKTVFPYGASWKVWSNLEVQTVEENGTVTHVPVMALSSRKNLHKLVRIVWVFSQHNNFGLLAKRKLPWGRFYFFILSHVSGSCFCYLDASVPFLGFKCAGSLWL